MYVHALHHCVTLKTVACVLPYFQYLWYVAVVILKTRCHVVTVSRLNWPRSTVNFVIGTVYFRMCSMHFHTIMWKNCTLLRPAMCSATCFHHGSVSSITHALKSVTRHRGIKCKSTFSSYCNAHVKSKCMKELQLLKYSVSAWLICIEYWCYMYIGVLM